MRTPYWHRNLVQGVARTLRRILAEDMPADQAVQRMLRAHPAWGARDRRWAAETVYEVVRFWRRLWAVAECPPTAVEEDLWRLIGIHHALSGVPLPPWPEFQGLAPEVLHRRSHALTPVRALRESVPDWLDQLAEQELGARWERELATLNRPADVVLRTNRLKTTREALRRRLAAEGVEALPVEGLPDALVLRTRAEVTRTQAFRAGWFEVQDGASQQVAPFLGVEPGMTVVDACAGAGGKALHLAALMQNEGILLALDVDASRLEELRRRARRAGAAIVQTCVVSSSRSIDRFVGRADRVLLDVPCSGLGVLRRRPDLKWRLTPRTLARLRDMQRKIFRRYAPIVGPGGRLVYATCSVLPSENARQVEAFLVQQGGSYERIAEQMLWPSETGFDGFYMALLERRR